LSALQGEELAIFEKYVSPVQFPHDSCIIREGDPGDGCYIIDEGTIRLELHSAETDTDSVIGFLESGMFLGEFSLLDGKPRSASAYAHTDVKGRWFSKQSFEEICQGHPEVGLIISTAMGQDLTAKMREFNSKIAGYIFASDIDKDTHQIVARAVTAQQSFENWPEDRVDALLQEVAQAIAERAEELAEATVAETGMGKFEDKVAKIRFASLEVYKTTADHLASGLLWTDSQTRVTEFASPVGIVLGLIPVTNPVPTIVFKALISLKGRNALILSCHRDALGVGSKACDIIRDVLEHHGAPKDLIQTILHRTSRQKTMMFMNHPDISLILATGGTSMVKAAYSSGTPAIGVGPGNAPVLICADADLSKAAQSVIQSKSFDNGVICGSENNLVVVASVRDDFIKMLEAHGAIVLRSDEKNRFTAGVFDPEHMGLQKSIVGKSAEFIADSVGIRRGKDSRLIVVPARQDELQGHYGHEKLAPILSLYTVNDEAEGLQVCKQILKNQGCGHTAVIYTENQDLIKQFGREIEASRILVNVPAAQGCIGLGTGLTPSFTLGCGTFGGNSTTDNIGYKHMINVKRLALNL
ncbi:MAG: aldehyde dehydrogenase family protein, partial [Chloroflexota bacterium]|nr:aldehyde dehydrogenase family protein [Chloroflexota bacterium]